VVAATAMALAACTTTPSAPTTTAPGTRTVSNATFEWTISREADNGSFAPGQVNYWSAGQSDSTQATYVATNGNATVLKKNASGTYVPIGSEAAVSWANRTKDGAGNTVTATNAFYLGQKVRYANGTGTVNTTTGAATIQWTGTFTINFYGQYVPFWIVNPKLTVAAGGSAKLTATLGGYASSMDDPDVRTPLAPTANVVVAEFANVWAGGSTATGFTAATKYLGNTITAPAEAPQVAKTSANQAYWGAWPQSFVNFQNATGLGSYWYTSGGTADPKKPQEPVSVAYTLNP
jgi:hypothetical protein